MPASSTSSRGHICSTDMAPELAVRWIVLRPNLIRDPGFESLFMIWDWFESFFQDSDPGFANDSQDFAKILRGFVEKWEKILTFGNLKCQVLLKNARFLLKDSQKSQNWKIDSDLPLIRIPKLKIRWRLESLKLGFGLNTIILSIGRWKFKTREEFTSVRKLLPAFLEPPFETFLLTVY